MNNSKQALIVTGILVIVLLTVLFLVNYLTLQKPLSKVLSSDPRNDGIEARAHYADFFRYGTLVFNLRTVGGANSQADVFRVLLQFAAEMEDEDFESVELAHSGETKFLLDGQAFKELGREYGDQNPVYTMRTFPSKLRRPSGAEAFSTWTGGILGVTTRQMEDFGEFHREWYLDDLIRPQ